MKKRILSTAIFLLLGGVYVTKIQAESINCDSPVFKDSEECKKERVLKKDPESKHPVITVSDWKNPPKKIPWSTIVQVESPFETYKAVWDQDYRGRSCFISCDFYEGFISRWTADQLSIAEFRTSCFLNCTKRYKDIAYGVELAINGEIFSLSGNNGLFVLNAKVRRAITASESPAKISVRIGGGNSSIYNIGDQTSIAIAQLIKEAQEEDKAFTAKGYKLNLSSAIKRSEKVQPIIKRALPGVVQVQTPRGKGTGFIVDKSGLIITNRHVVGRFKDVTISFNDSSEKKATVIGRTSDLDVALLEIKGKKNKTFQSLPLCIKKSPTVGEDIVVIGNPLGLSSTTTRGIISGVRNDDGYTMVQIDAPINPGNSGGPIVNYNSEVVGIVTAKKVGMGIEGIGFGIGITSALESLGVQIEKEGNNESNWFTKFFNRGERTECQNTIS